MKRALALALALVAAGCWSQVEDHCPACKIVGQASRTLPPLDRHARAWVVLVPGAFGFDGEWRPVLAALRAAPDLDFFVYTWPGPWHHPAESTLFFAQVLQLALAYAPPEVLLIGHSAGAMLADCAAGLVHVPPGHRLVVAAVAGPGGFALTPYYPERRVDTPLGLAVGGDWPGCPPPGPRVSLTDYHTDDPPRAPPPPSPVRDVWLGAHAGHNRSLGLVAVPLIRALAR